MSTQYLHLKNQKRVSLYAEDEIDVDEDTDDGDDDHDDDEEDIVVD